MTNPNKQTVNFKDTELIKILKQKVQEVNRCLRLAQDQNISCIVIFGIPNTKKGYKGISVECTKKL